MGAAEKAEFIQKYNYSFQPQVECFQLTVKVLHMREAIRTSKTQGIQGIFKASVTLLSLRQAPQANTIPLEIILFNTKNPPRLSCPSSQQHGNKNKKALGSGTFTPR